MTTTLPRKRIGSFGEFAPVERLFENFFDLPWKGSSFSDVVPYSGFALDIEDDGDQYKISAELPAVKKDEVDLDLEQNLLTISVKQEEEKEEKKKNFLHRERRSMQSSRTITLPSDAQLDSLDARLDNGLLKITIQKQAEKKAKKIKVG